MKKRIIISCLLISTISFAQVGIGTSNPEAKLDIVAGNQSTPSNKDGILIPRIDAFPAVNPTAAQNSMIVYLTTTSAGKQPGFYYWNNAVTSWMPLTENVGWALAGNAGTDPAVNFIGTTDHKDLVFKRNNTVAGTISTINTSYGVNSLSSISTGVHNTAIGIDAMKLTTTGHDNTAVGTNSLLNNKTGVGNAAVGFEALLNNDSGSRNVAVGEYSLYSNTSGFNNVAIGNEALAMNTTGIFNSGLGSSTLQDNTTGTANVAVGFDALYKNQIGHYNVAAGYKALQNCTDCSHNIGIGREALKDVTGNNNIGIGANVVVPILAGSNQVRIGNGAVNYAGVEVAWSTTSDKRLKKNIEIAKLGLDFVNSLRPVTYARKTDSSAKIEFGIIAQELEEALIKSGITNSGMITKDDQGMYSVRYNDLFAPLIKSVQELSSENKRLMNEIHSLEIRLKNIEDKLNIK